jgi:hypothetical protein
MININWKTKVSRRVMASEMRYISVECIRDGSIHLSETHTSIYHMAHNLNVIEPILGLHDFSEEIINERS